jgi:hypothetical protein
MRSPTHFDEVVARHGDRLTAWLEDAVDAADEEAERAMAAVSGVPKPGEQVRAVPQARTGLQPPWVKS